MEIKNLIEDMEVYQQGFQRGRELALEKYDKMIIELWEKMADVEKKVDSVLIILRERK